MVMNNCWGAWGWAHVWRCLECLPLFTLCFKLPPWAPWRGRCVGGLLSTIAMISVHVLQMCLCMCAHLERRDPCCTWCPVPPAHQTLFSPRIRCQEFRSKPPCQLQSPCDCLSVRGRAAQSQGCQDTVQHTYHSLSLPLFLCAPAALTSFPDEQTLYSNGEHCCCRIQHASHISQCASSRLWYT